MKWSVTVLDYGIAFWSFYPRFHKLNDAIPGIRSTTELGYMQHPLRFSPCCREWVLASLADGILTGSCGKCGRNLVQKNSVTGEIELLIQTQPAEEVNESNIVAIRCFALDGNTMVRLFLSNGEAKDVEMPYRRTALKQLYTLTDDTALAKWLESRGLPQLPPPPQDQGPAPVGG